MTTFAPVSTEITAIESALRQAIDSTKRTTWAACELMRAAADAWQDARRDDGGAYRSHRDWASAVTGLHRSTVSRMLTAATAYAALPAPLQERALGVDPLRLYTVRDELATAPEAALARAEAATAMRELIDEAETARGEKSAEWFDWKVRLPDELRPLFDRVMNRARFALNRAMPSDVAVVEWLLAKVDEMAVDVATVLKPHELRKWEDEWNRIELAQVTGNENNSAEAEIAKLRETYKQRVVDIDEGRARCVLTGTRMAVADCAGWDASSLDSHHCVPRSLVNEDASPQVRICRKCHEHHGSGARWKKLAKFLGVDVDAVRESGRTKR